MFVYGSGKKAGAFLIIFVLNLFHLLLSGAPDEHFPYTRPRAVSLYFHNIPGSNIFQLVLFYFNHLFQLCIIEFFSNTNPSGGRNAFCYVFAMRVRCSLVSSVSALIFNYRKSDNRRQFTSCIIFGEKIKDDHPTSTAD